ncbi:hypothetical protein AB0L75_07490 [Streptomyces sp. NPDC052101]|uniref:hypothetical protein n=1 Tax=Streptomyces sp. NPDC052101 TaxID=3155763 RepID=UPI0034329C3F
MTTKSEPLEPGSLLYDPATCQVGEYRDRSGPYAMLRPVGGGREWQADPAVLRPATDRERLLDGLSRPPRPVPGCPACAGLAGRREAARAEYDRSAETDANVLLRQHQRKEHRA